MNEIVLHGCTPTPLASYLKALGVLRLLSSVRPDTRAAWQGNYLVIHTAGDREALERFFLRDYQPTPVMAPWNGGSGFYEKDNKAALKAIQESTSPRLALYRQCLRLGEQALDNIDRSASPKDTAKTALLGKLRGSLPDAALDWFDSSVLLSGESAQYPPLLGTGGNDGRLDFTNNFMQRLGEVLHLVDDAPSRESVDWLKMALHGEPAPGLIKKAIGQFYPGQVGGPNATNGFEADSAINPWDFVFMIEGALLFAAAAVRRNADDPEGTLSYPFTLRAVGAGAGCLGEGDAASARGELWMPLWRQSPRSAHIGSEPSPMVGRTVQHARQATAQPGRGHSRGPARLSAQ
jgi:CRISPR-associated protein Csx17